MKTIDRIIYFLEYICLRGVALFVNLIPYSFALKIGKFAGTLLYLYLPRRRGITLENLRIAYPEKSEEELQEIAKKAFQNMAQIAIEFVSIPRLVQQKVFEVRHGEYVWGSLEKKKGVLFIVSHLTNWEIMAVAYGMEGFPMYAIARPFKNPYVYQYVKKLRGYGGLQSIDKSGAIRETVKLLKQNKVVSFLIDQHERQSAVVVNFFGRPCYTSSVAARIAMKWKVPAIFAFAYRDEHDRVITDFEKPFELIDTGNEEADARANTQLFVNAIEKQVRKMPANWLWMHRRWRVEPT